MLASELYAQSESVKCEGKEECHWCSAPCRQEWIHDGPLNLPFMPKGEWARCPANNWICKGCWLWRRKRVSVRYLHGLICDGRCPRDHSWWITDTEAFALGLGNDWQLLQPMLLKPPTKFCLSIISKPTNLLQRAVVNENYEIKNDTELRFTLDNVEMSWTVYELEDALTGEANGRSPGVQALVRLLTPILPPPKSMANEEPEEVKRGRGRPVKPEPHSEGPHKLVRASGQ